LASSGVISALRVTGAGNSHFLPAGNRAFSAQKSIFREKSAGKPSVNTHFRGENPSPIPED
jgi:hypothetical protein